MMPRISGFEMLDILRNTDELKNTKVIMLTALGQAEDRNRADNLGADKYLVKSQVTLEDIVNAAKELLSDEPAQVAVQITPQEMIPAPEPVVAAQTAVPVAATPSEPVMQQVATPAGMPEPINPPVAEPVAVMVPPAPTTSTPTAPEPVEQAVQVDVSVAEEQSDVAAPVEAAPMTTTVTVTDPDPITQRISPQPEPIQAEESAASVQVIAPEPATELETPATLPEVTSATTAEPQTLAAEEAAIEAQIASFATSAQPPALTVEPSGNDAILDDAINKLTATPSTAPVPAEQPTDAPATMVEPSVDPSQEPVPSPVDTTSQITGRKVIQPLSDAAGTTNLDVLLAQEEAKEAAAGQGNPQPIVGQPNPASPQSTGFDPNSIAL